MKLWLLLAVLIIQGLQAELCYKYSGGRIKYMKDNFDQYKSKLNGIQNYDGKFFVQQELPLSFKPPKGYLKPTKQNIKVLQDSNK